MKDEIAVVGGLKPAMFTADTLTADIELATRYVEHIAQYNPEKLALLLMLMKWSVNGFAWPYEEMKTILGYTGEYDTAKPQPYMDKLREMGLPRDMLDMTVWWYPRSEDGQREAEQLSSVKCRIIDTLLK